MEMKFKRNLAVEACISCHATEEEKSEGLDLDRPRAVGLGGLAAEMLKHFC
jgi:hypothetical protein